DPVTAAQLREIEDRVMALFKRIAEAREIDLPDRDALLGHGEAGTEGAGQRLFTLATRIPIGTSDRYTVLAAASAADRLAALSEAVDALSEVVEFQLSE